MANVLDIIGPVMVGPSSSHTAGAARLGGVARALLGAEATSARVTLYGSFAKTFRGHGTDRALAAGILGMPPDDPRLRDALSIAAERGVDILFEASDEEAAHPNSARIRLRSADGAFVDVTGCSVGGGQVLVTSVDGMAVRLTGARAAFVVKHRDAPGLIASVTDVLAECGANICDFSLSREKRGGVAVMTIEVEGDLDPRARKRVERLRDVVSCTVLEPLGDAGADATAPVRLPGLSGIEPGFAPASLAAFVAEAERSGAPLSTVVLAQQASATGLAPGEIYAGMLGRLRVMSECIDAGCAEGLRSMSGLVGGDARRMREALSGGRSAYGDFMGGVVYRALAVSELNASMGRIVAAPTAGSCGIIPGVLLTLRDELGYTEDDCARALMTAGGVGLVIQRNATLAGAEGGCQAETGAAAAMAAAAMVELRGGAPQASSDAASMAIQALLGLVCDPVAGLVEVPCAKRNATGATVAVTCAEMALAGVRAAIPFDEAVDAMRRVGSSLPPSLRETGEGGVAATPTAKSLAAGFLSGCGLCGGCS